MTQISSKSVTELLRHLTQYHMVKLNVYVMYDMLKQHINAGQLSQYND
jgi:hypothetical protein